MGMVVVAFFAADADVGDEATIRSTLRRTSSTASSFRRSAPLLSANRYSMAIFFPSIHPSLLSSCRNASKRTALPEAVLTSRKPMRATFPVCSASAGEQSARSTADRVRTVIFLFMFFSALSTRHSTLDTRPFLLNHLIRSRQHVGRNRQADLLRSI